VGEPRAAVLALAGAVRHPLDGRGAISYTVLQCEIVACNGRSSRLAAAVGNDLKGKVSLAMYAASIGLAFVKPWIAIGLYIAVALMWLVPDRRIEKHLND
jgi:uncharacterized membrane protein